MKFRMRFTANSCMGFHSDGGLLKSRAMFVTSRLFSFKTVFSDALARLRLGFDTEDYSEHRILQNIGPGIL